MAAKDGQESYKLTDGFTFSTERLREETKNLNSKWMFPVRMENSGSIVWVESIVEALSKFKAPVTESIWRNLIEKGYIAAELVEEQERLKQWWEQGWYDMPPMESKNHHGTPICEIKQTPMGDTLHMIYPSFTMWSREKGYKDYGTAYRALVKLLKTAPIYYKPLKKLRFGRAVEKEKHWILFAPDNTIIEQFNTKKEIREYLNCTITDLDRWIATPGHQMLNGCWIWKNDWGLIPVAPNGEALPSDWRQKA